MANPIVSVIAVVGKNRELGRDNQLLWHLPEDLKRFKKLTLGHAVIMGRKTFESLGRPLQGRLNIVISRNKDYQAKGIILCHSLSEALQVAKQKEKKEIFIIGGGQIYQQALSLADKLYLTLVDASCEADAFFPDYAEFKKIVKEDKKQSGKYKYVFLELEKG